MSHWSEDVLKSLTPSSVTMLCGPSGSGKTHFAEHVLKGSVFFPPEGPLRVGPWLERSVAAAFDFSGQRTIVVIDDVDTLTPTDRTAVLDVVKKISRGAHRPLLLIGQSIKPLVQPGVKTIAIERVASAEEAAGLIASHPLLEGRMSRTEILACCRRSRTPKGIDLNQAVALALTEGMHAVTSRSDASVGCNDAVELLASTDALEPSILERRVDADPTTAFSLVFENVDALFSRVYCAGRKRAVAQSNFVKMLSEICPLSAHRHLLAAALVHGMLAHLGALPRRQRCTTGAKPFAKAALWSRGASVSQAASRRAERASESHRPIVVVRASELS